MKKYFLLMSGLLLSVCGFVACSDDNTTPAPEPTFPELVTKTATAGEVIELSFSANYDWTATISEDTYTYFQLLSGETTVNTLSGVAGEQTIKVQVADVVIFENAPVAEVTLTMNELSQVIAKITYPTTARETAVYAPEVNTWGGFKSAGVGSELLYSYNATAMTADDAVVMEWGVERKNYEDDDTFFAPVLVEANFDYTLAGPAWMTAAAAGVAGQTEYIVKADLTKIPAESETATIDVLAGEEAVASFKVAITGANDFVPQVSLFSEAEYAFDGEAIEAIEGSMVAGQFVKVVCDATGAAAEWLTVSEEAQSDAVITTYEITATAEANDGAARTAYVFYFAKNAAPSDNASLFENGEVKEEYAEKLAVTVTQYSEPATIAIEYQNGLTAETSDIAFEEGLPSSVSAWLMYDALFSGKNVGAIYNVYFTGAEAYQAGVQAKFVASDEIKEVLIYCFNDGVNLSEGQTGWTTLRVELESNNTTFSINAYPFGADDVYKNPQSGDYEAVILVEYNSGEYSVIYLRYNESVSGTSGGGDEITEVTFVNPMEAEMYGATLVQLTEADTELYDPTAVDEMGNPILQYHLTYTMMGTTLALSLPSYDMAYPQAEWIMYEGTNTELYVGMMVEEAAIGILNFYKGSMAAVRIVCEYAPANGGNEGDGGNDAETIDWDYVCGAYQVTIWDNPWWHADITRRYDQMGHGFWHNYVKLASDCKVDGVPCGTPKDGQRYGVVYSWNNHAFFNIAQTEINPETWVAEEGTGCYALTDLIDREEDYDGVIDNKSYYNKNEEAFYFSFTLTSGGVVYRHNGKLHSRGTVEEK